MRIYRQRMTKANRHEIINTFNCKHDFITSRRNNCCSNGSFSNSKRNISIMYISLPHYGQDVILGTFLSRGKLLLDWLPNRDKRTQNVLVSIKSLVVVPIRFTHFLWALTRNENQTDLSRLWTQDADSNYYDDNVYVNYAVPWIVIRIGIGLLLVWVTCDFLRSHCLFDILQISKIFGIHCTFMLATLFFWFFLSWLCKLTNWSHCGLNIPLYLLKLLFSLVIQPVTTFNFICYQNMSSW